MPPRNPTTSYRLDAYTLRQIDELANKLNTSKANVIIHAIHNLYREEINTMTTPTTYEFTGEMYGNPDFVEPRPRLTEAEVLADWENLRKCFNPDPGDLKLGSDADGPAFLDSEGNTVYSAVNR